MSAASAGGEPPPPPDVPTNSLALIALDASSLAAAKAQQTAVAPAQRVQGYLLAARAEATRRAYASDWAHFTLWCQRTQDYPGGPLRPLPARPEAVALYLAEHAGQLTVATLVRRCSAISAVHQAAGHPSPTTSPLVRTTLAGIRRVHRTAPAGKDPLLAHQLRQLLDALPRQDSKALLAARDRCLLVLGFYGALRRSELVALDLDDIYTDDQGLVLTLRRSKTDQDGHGRRIAMLHTGVTDTCPTEVYQSWLAALQRALPRRHPDTDPLTIDKHPTTSTTGTGAGGRPVFRPITRHGAPQPRRLTDRAVARIVQRTAMTAGLADRDLAGHSLRAGFATSAAAAGKSERAIMKQTGHKSLPMVRRYIREGSLFRDNATEGLIL